MKLSTKGRYAVMALTDLARHEAAGPVSLSDISLRQGISLAYLEQIFVKLRRAGIVSSTRGPGGGYVLSHGAEGTRVLDIMLAVDEPIKTTRCGGDTSKGCHAGSARCLTHDLWAELGHMIEMFLASVSLADVVARRNLSPYGLDFLREGPRVPEEQGAA
ncbi:Rrf2 family transcriptional regulator [Futiania mangrovi]|uniref:Rrf2 family transcriptional regulator n=1 Tax=Futiania mangrovi TaxID=2959716 RepID=A0A9J6PGG7_9PROT|nr:Rrf2 family transcriptional regulator [Futiania mangrovii]MCP1335695.1 Rrf2 family transcriptional regulator [Futiania mangrovii]